MWEFEVAHRLRVMRRQRRLGQVDIADQIGSSVSEISRLERGQRQLRVNQLGPWARALGCQVEVVLWEGDDKAGLAEEDRQVLTEVASSLNHLPKAAKQALIHQMRIWRQSDID